LVRAGRLAARVTQKIDWPAGADPESTTLIVQVARIDFGPVIKELDGISAPAITAASHKRPSWP